MHLSCSLSLTLARLSLTPHRRSCRSWSLKQHYAFFRIVFEVNMITINHKEMNHAIDCVQNVACNQSIPQFISQWPSNILSYYPWCACPCIFYFIISNRSKLYDLYAVYLLVIGQDVKSNHALITVSLSQPQAPIDFCTSSWLPGANCTMPASNNCCPSMRLG